MYQEYIVTLVVATGRQVVNREGSAGDQSHTKSTAIEKKYPSTHIRAKIRTLFKNPSKDKLPQVLLATGGYYPNNHLYSTQMIVLGSKIL